MFSADSCGGRWNCGSSSFARTIGPDMFKQSYANVFAGDSRWNQVQSPEGELYQWDGASTYIKHPPYFEGMRKTPEAVQPIAAARCSTIRIPSIRRIASR